MRATAFSLGTAATVVFVAAMAVVISIWLNTPWLASVRGPLQIGVPALLVGGLVACRWLQKPLRRAAIGIVLSALAVFVATILQAHVARWRTHRAAEADLRLVARHIMVGYRDRSELASLITRGIGGVFVTARNARHLTAEQLAAELAEFQRLARAHGHPPLIIATDQEGGFVSRLSPPLARPELLAGIVRRAPDAQGRDAAIRDAAERSGRDLAKVGITLNFAPLADLDFGIRNPKDRMSRIGERALSDDPEVAAGAAATYCQALGAQGVMCTLKHFPGLGRIAADTHVESAVLSASLSDLDAKDWRPFREVLARTPVAIMVGHVRLDAVDASAPASLSARVIGGILRETWAFNGMVVTDDLNMSATSDLPGGVGSAAVRALAAGADIALIAYDPDQVYPALSALSDALRSGRLDPAVLARSKARLDLAVSRK